MKLPPVLPVPLEHLDPQTPQLIQLVRQWQKLWQMAVARQNRLEQHQQMLREVFALSFKKEGIFACLSTRTSAVFSGTIYVKVAMLCLSLQMEEFANFDFNIWRKRYIQWISHLKSRILDVFRSIDRDQDGRISQKEFTDYVLASSKILMPVFFCFCLFFEILLNLQLVTSTMILKGTHVFCVLRLNCRISDQLSGDERSGEHF